MNTTRIEKDVIGELELPVDVLYGIHTARAIVNFPITLRPVNRILVHAYGAVKLAAASVNHDLSNWDAGKFDAISASCREMMSGSLDDHIVVDALQGGTGTSTNMNVNEVIANRALQMMGKRPGDYLCVHPLNDINMNQSTNDTYPTALKVAVIGGLRDLERAVIRLLESFQEKEKEFSGVVKVARTQLQDAVLTTMGRTMSAFAETFGRDRWRLYKCEERLRVINLGGTAIGTGLTAPKQYIFAVTDKLKEITGYGLARAENMIDCTQNTDVFAEVSGMMNACAVNLLKVSGDIRLMASGPDAGIGELELPAVQAGSSVMPGKINPVVPEAVSQAAMQVMANNGCIAQACSMGNLELNSFMPIIADRLLESVFLLRNACEVFADRCVSGIRVRSDVCSRHVHGATALLTALLDEIGYEAAEEVSAEARMTGRAIREIVIEKGLLPPDRFDELTSAETVTALGSRRRT